MRLTGFVLSYVAEWSLLEIDLLNLPEAGGSVPFGMDIKNRWAGIFEILEHFHSISVLTCVATPSPRVRHLSSPGLFVFVVDVVAVVFGWEGGGDCFFGLLVTNLFQVILRDSRADSRGERQIKRAKSVRAEFTRRAGTAPGRIPLTD